MSSTHLTFLSPLEPGLREIFARFRRVMTVEINYSDARGAPYITEENRRLGRFVLGDLKEAPRGATRVEVAGLEVHDPPVLVDGEDRGGSLPGQPRGPYVV